MVYKLQNLRSKTFKRNMATSQTSKRRKRKLGDDVESASVVAGAGGGGAAINTPLPPYIDANFVDGSFKISRAFITNAVINGRLKGALLFEVLSGIRQSGFRAQPGTDNLSDFFRKICRYQLTTTNWLTFVHFVKYGEVRGLLKISDVSSLIYQLESICEIFGGVPSFDAFMKLRMTSSKLDTMEKSTLTYLLAKAQSVVLLENDDVVRNTFINNQCKDAKFNKVVSVPNHGMGYVFMNKLSEDLARKSRILIHARCLASLHDRFRKADVCIVGTQWMLNSSFRRFLTQSGVSMKTYQQAVSQDGNFIVFNRLTTVTKDKVQIFKPQSKQTTNSCKLESLDESD